MTVSSEMVERMLDAYWGKPTDRQWSDVERKVMRDALTAALSDQVVVPNSLATLRQAIIDHTHGDLFWIGEILLNELEKETGFKGAPEVG